MSNVGIKAKRDWPTNSVILFEKRKWNQSILRLPPYTKIWEIGDSERAEPSYADHLGMKQPLDGRLVIRLRLEVTTGEEENDAAPFWVT